MRVRHVASDYIVFIVLNPGNSWVATGKARVQALHMSTSEGGMTIHTAQLGCHEQRTRVHGTLTSTGSGCVVDKGGLKVSKTEGREPMH